MRKLLSYLPSPSFTQHSFLTIISTVQMDLVCEKNGFIEASQSMFMAGCTIGCLLFGGISDRYIPKTLVDGVK